MNQKCHFYVLITYSSQVCSLNTCFKTVLKTDKNIKMVKSEKAPFGYIYRANNDENGKNYLGQTVTSRWGDDKIPIKEHWNEEVREAYAKQRRGENLRSIESAIIKYGPENFKLIEQDVASNQEELDKKETQYIKDYDSMVPKGYNMTEGGMGGRPSQEVREKLSNISSEKWHKDPQYIEKQMNARKELTQNKDFLEKMTKINQERAKDPEWREKMTKINQERAKNPEWREKMTKINQERAKDPEWREKMTKINQERAKDPEWREKMTKINQERAKNPEWREKITKINREITQRPGYSEKMSKTITKKWGNDSEYRKKQEDERKERAKDPNFINKMREIGKKTKKEISDKRQFLNDIKNNMPKKEMLEKYDIGKTAFTKRIKEMFGPNGPKNYTELKDYLQGKDINDVLKDIQEKQAEEQGNNEESIDNSEKSEDTTSEEKLEGKDSTPKNTDKGSLDDKNSRKKKDDEIVEKDQEEEVEGEKEKSTEEQKDEKSDDPSEEEIIDVEESPMVAPTDESDDQQENQFEKSSDNLSNEFSRKPPKGIIIGPLELVSSDEEKSKERTDLDKSRDKRDEKPKFTSGHVHDASGEKQSNDYEGIDQTRGDKGEDFKGIDKYDGESHIDYHGLDDTITEKGSDFDGIDSPQEKGDKDYDDIDEEYPKAGVESGGEP